MNAKKLIALLLALLLALSVAPLALAEGDGEGQAIDHRVAVYANSEELSTNVDEKDEAKGATVEKGEGTIAVTAPAVEVTGTNAVNVTSQDKDSVASVTVTEDVKLTAGTKPPYATGVYAEAYAGGTAGVSAKGLTVDSSSVENGDGTGVYAVAGGGTAAVVVGENGVSVSGDYGAGIIANASRTGSAAVVVDGGVDVSSKYNAEGAQIRVEDAGSVAFVGINGDLTVTATEQASATGARIHAENLGGLKGTEEAARTAGGLLVNGNVTATGSEYSTGIEAQGSGDAEIAAVVVGDVTSDGVGLRVGGDTDATVNVLIDGTLSGEKGSLEISTYDWQMGGTAVSENTNVYVWELDTTQTFTEDTGLNEDQQEEFLQNNVQYIVRHKDPKKGAKLTVGGVTTINPTEGTSYDVAHENDVVTLTVKTDKNYKLTGAYNGKEKVALKKDAKGNYSLVVPRGGGVYLTVSLEKLPGEKVVEDRIIGKTTEGKELTMVSTKRFVLVVDDAVQFLTFRVEDGQVIFTMEDGTELVLAEEDGRGYLTIELPNGDTLVFKFNADDLARLKG